VNFAKFAATSPRAEAQGFEAVLLATGNKLLMKIGRWDGLYPRIQSAAKHIRCGFVCGYRKIAGLFRSERSAIIGAAQPGVHGPDLSENRATKKEREQ